MIASTATNPKLTDEGGPNVFRMVGRDDQQGPIAWAQAVEQAGTFETTAVADALHAGEFDTVIGRVGFDANGDVTGYETFIWYIWRDGDYVPLEGEPATTQN